MAFFSGAMEPLMVSPSQSSSCPSEYSDWSRSSSSGRGSMPGGSAGTATWQSPTHTNLQLQQQQMTSFPDYQTNASKNHSVYQNHQLQEQQLHYHNMNHSKDSSNVIAKTGKYTSIADAFMDRAVMQNRDIFVHQSKCT